MPIVRVIAGREVFAAKWRFDQVRSESGRMSHAIVACRAAGTAVVTQQGEGGCVRRRPTIGAVTYVDPERPARWSVDGACEVWHVYLARQTLQRLAEADLGVARAPDIKPLFAFEDPWFKGYFQMLASEFELLAEGEQQTDTLFVDQAEHLLVHHLLRCHADGAPEPAGAHAAAGNPLRTTALKQVQAYVEANLAREIELADLAAVARMSVGHFMRSFRAASGTTPYRYVLDQRLSRARELLRTTRLPIGHIATECGFRTPSHLAAKFRARVGTSPSRYRESA